MGRPFEIATSPRDADAEETSSSGTGSSSDDEGWVTDDGEGGWEDPSSGGVLGRVFEAAESGDADALADLLQGLDVSLDTRGADSDTAIHLAALYGHTECVSLLLEKGARADVADADGALPLHDAAAGGYVDICRMLLEAAPAVIDRGDSEGDTPLHNAARGQHTDAVRLLLDRGADPSLQNDDFKTPVQLAERGTPLRQLLEEALAARQAASGEAGAAAGAEQQPQAAPPAADVA